MVYAFHGFLASFYLHQTIAVVLGKSTVRGILVGAQCGIGTHMTAEHLPYGLGRALAKLGHLAHGIPLPVDGARNAHKLVRLAAGVALSPSFPGFAPRLFVLELLLVALVRLDDVCLELFSNNFMEDLERIWELRAFIPDPTTPPLLYRSTDTEDMD